MSEIHQVYPAAGKKDDQSRPGKDQGQLTLVLEW